MSTSTPTPTTTPKATSKSFTIITPRLIITRFDAAKDAHCAFLVALYNTPAFIASVGGKPTSITSIPAARALISGRFEQEFQRNGWGYFLILLRRGSEGAEDDDDIELDACTPIGSITLLRGVEPNCYAAPDLGFALLSPSSAPSSLFPSTEDYTGKGYATEASDALLRYARECWGVRTVLGLFDPTNERSKGVFGRLGFMDKGLHELRVFGGVMGAVWVWGEGAERDVGVWGI